MLDGYGLEKRLVTINWFITDFTKYCHNGGASQTSESHRRPPFTSLESAASAKIARTRQTVLTQRKLLPTGTIYLPRPPQRPSLVPFSPASVITLCWLTGDI